MVTPLETVFPGLARGGYRVTSPRDGEYNCIAWAAGDTRVWWWPGRDAGKEYWPPGVPRERTRDAFAAAFASLGYKICEGEGPEAGYEKIALFADAAGMPTHASRQLPGGRWTSKLGKAEDVEHELHDLEGAVYGAVVLILRRAATAAELRVDGNGCVLLIQEIENWIRREATVENRRFSERRRAHAVERGRELVHNLR